jgi:very-short-patch-repair endonuclease
MKGLTRSRWYKTILPKEKEEAMRIVKIEMRAKLKALWTPERRVKKSKSMTGKNNPTKQLKVRSKMISSWTPERRSKQSEIMTGENNPNKRPEMRAKMSLARAGKNHHMYGRTGENNPSWRGGPIEKICLYCGNIFNVPKYKVKQGKGKFCSSECARIYNQKNKSEQTNIERAMEAWLVDNNINYTAEHLIKFDKSFTIVDFFIEPNICLYCDGDYWHSILKVQARDVKQNESLSAMGYNVIRLSETEILNGVRPDLK